MVNIKIIQNFQFPIAGWIILIHELLERFSFYGMKGILALYLNIYLGFDEDTSTILYHLFTGFAYLTPIIGAIIADNYLGRYKTILSVGLIYLIGHLLMPLTAIRKNIPGPLVGMLILAIGAGGIKSSVAAFGGDQLPSGKEEMVEKFFSIFYTSINIGALLAQFVTPILRSDISCVDNYCYPLAFGVPAVVFLIAYILFVAGTRKYNIVPRSENVLTEFVRCVYIALTKFLKERKVKKYKKIMDYAKDDFKADFIIDCETALRIFVIFTPIPVFWALYDQQGSRWTLQAKNMEGRIGSAYIIKPEQIQAFNALFIIALIPIFDFIIYPVCNRMNVLIKPTSRLVTSYAVAAISFIVAGILQIYIVKGQSINFASLLSKFSLINNVDNCNLSGNFAYNTFLLNLGQSKKFDVTEKNNILSLSCNSTQKYTFNLSFVESQMQSGIIFFETRTNSLNITLKNVTIQRKDGFGHIRSILTNENEKENIYSLEMDNLIYNITPKYSTIPVGKYDIICTNNVTIRKKCGHTVISPGIVGSLIISLRGKSFFFEEFQPQLIHMLWQLPQYILITGAEILCSITALSFAYSESPDSMKSLMQAVYLLTIFGGNIIVVIVASISNNISQTIEFFIFALLVLIAGFVNWILIRHFWSQNSDKKEESLELQ